MGFRASSSRTSGLVGFRAFRVLGLRVLRLWAAARDLGFLVFRFHKRLMLLGSW